MRIRLLREAGGIGDVVRCLGCARSLKLALPDCEIGFYSLPGYEALVRLSPDVDLFAGVTMRERRRRDELPDPAVHTYLRDGGTWDATVDLYCPAWVHERESRGRVVLDRIGCWTLAAQRTVGVPLEPRLAWLTLPERLRGRAQGWLEGRGLIRRRRRPLVALSPISLGGPRCWSLERTRELVVVLKAAGVDVIFFHVPNAVGEAWQSALEVPAALGVDIDLLFGLVAACDLVVSVDTGLYHVAAAAGTPAVGLFGFSNGHVMRRYYPRHEALHAEPEVWRRLPCRGAPCYGFTDNGFEKELCGAGCVAMAAVPAELVAERVLRRLG